MTPSIHSLPCEETREIGIMDKRHATANLTEVYKTVLSAVDFSSFFEFSKEDQTGHPQCYNTKTVPYEQI